MSKPWTETIAVVACSLFVAIAVPAAARSEEGPTASNVPGPAPLSPDEPKIGAFSPVRAAEALDISALDWQKTRKCAACHTLPPYMMARPLLSAVVPEPPEVRPFFETIVERRLEGEPSLPKDAVSAVVIQVAAALAFHDRAASGKLHPRTREELDRMWTLQREDGSWEWPFRDTPPVKSDEHFGVTLAALGVGVAPENYAASSAAQKGLAKIREFLEAHPPCTLHQKAMLLWASRHVDDLLAPQEIDRTVAELASVQRPDGGWSLANLVDNSGDGSRQTDASQKMRTEKGYAEVFLVYAGRENAYKSSLASDGYATGFVVYILRQAGAPANDPRIRRGVAWLKENQRESGRWFTPSQGWHTKHYIANAGTAYAVLALHACGEIPGPRQGAK